MKNIKILLAVLLLSSILLVGCNKTDEVVDVKSDSAVGTQNITDEEKIAEMIKLIEAEEARMIDAGELPAE